MNIEVLKPNTVAVKLNNDEKIVFGAAPEFIKTFLAHGENIPEYIVLSQETFKSGINFAEIEFSIYNNFFFQNGKRVKVICTPDQEKRLRTVLTVTLFGPDFDKLLKNEKDKNKITQYKRLRSFRDLLIPRDNNGKVIILDGYVEFINFIDHQAVIHLKNGDDIYILSSKKSPDAFTILDKNKKLIGNIDLSDIIKDEFDFPVQRSLLSHDEFGFLVLDSGDGFSPEKYTSSFLLWLEGKPFLVDPMAYSEQYLKRKGIDAGEIYDIFISHNHGDHDQGVYNYLIKERRIRLIGSWVVIEQSLQKVSAAINKSVADLRKIVDVVALPVGKEVKLPGYDNITVELEYGLHSIPSNMIKFRYKDNKDKTINTLGYSGDTIFDKEKYKKWKSEGFIDQKTEDILINSFNDADIIIHEAGAGLIHTKMEDFAQHFPNKEIYWVHTNMKKASVGKKVLAAGDQITIIEEHKEKKKEWFIKLFEKVPLFANLSNKDKSQLANMAVEKKEIEMVTYLAGETIVKEGDLPRDDSIYIIAQGSVDILQKGNHIATLGVGQQLGEMALFGNNAGRRNATVRAFTGMKLIKIHKDAYKDLLDNIENTYLNYYEARPVLDASNSPFKGLNHNILDNIAVRMHKEVFETKPDGKPNILIKKGDHTKRELYLIIEGEVGAIVDKNKGIVFKVGKGSVLGEMSLLDSKSLPCATVVTATKKVVTFSLNKKAFDEIIEMFPPVRYVLEGISQHRKKINAEALLKFKEKK